VSEKFSSENSEDAIGDAGENSCAFCLRRILNVTFHEATRSKENSSTKCVGNQNKERMTRRLQKSRRGTALDSW